MKSKRFHRLNCPKVIKENFLLSLFYFLQNLIWHIHVARLTWLRLSCFLYKWYHHNDIHRTWLVRFRSQIKSNTTRDLITWLSSIHEKNLKNEWIDGWEECHRVVESYEWSLLSPITHNRSYFIPCIMLQDYKEHIFLLY